MPVAAAAEITPCVSVGSEGNERATLLHNMYWYRAKWAEEEVELLLQKKGNNEKAGSVSCYLSPGQCQLCHRSATEEVLLEAINASDEEGLTSQHYLGHAAVRNAIQALGIRPDAKESPIKVLDIGGGIGGTVRYMASNLPYIEAISLDISESFARLAEEIDAKERNGYQEGSTTRYIADDIFTTSQAALGGPFDCACHMDNKLALFTKLKEILRPASSDSPCHLYFEDLIIVESSVSEADRVALRDVVACPALCTEVEYRKQLMKIFGDNCIVQMDCEDTTREWREFTKSRFAIFNESLPRHVSVHGQHTTDAYRTFYGTTADLFDRGVIGGVRALLAISEQ